MKLPFARIFFYSGLVLSLALRPLLAGEDPPESLRPPAGVSQAEFQKVYREGANLQLIFRAIYENVRPSVVRVVAEAAVPAQGGAVPEELLQDPFFRQYFESRAPRNQKKVVSFGTGFIVDARGLIATNRHVVGSAKQVKVHLFDGRVLDGVVRGSDERTDVALVEVSGARDLTAVAIGDSEAVRVGDFAIAVGNPFGLDGTFTTGVISGIHRAGLDESGMKFLQTDASINQGNSGGPLLNLRGEVIGINRMIYSPSGGSIGIGFAIPIRAVQPIMAQLATNGRVERALLGVQIDAAVTQGAAVIPGALVVGVVKGSGAQEAGIAPGDLIRKVDGRLIRSPEELMSYIQSKRAGDTLEIEFLRREQALRVNAKLKNM